MNKEMQKALEADGEKLHALTGEDHGPVFIGLDLASGPDTTAISGAEVYLQDLTRRLTDAMAERERRMTKAREYWDGKPRSMLNDRLREIDFGKLYAQFTLETADIRATREQVIDALTQIDMAKPLSTVILQNN